MDNKLISISLADKQLGTNVYKVAIASSDGIVINQHFGRADTFYIYEVLGMKQCKFIEKREVTSVCNGGNHDNKDLRACISRLKDCKYVLASRIGMGAVNMLEQSGITPMELPGIMEESLDKLMTYEQLQHLF